MKVLFLSGADQYGGGSYQMAKNILQYAPLYDKKIKYVVLTQRYGLLNQWCEEMGIENYCLPYRYCVYFPHKNKMLNFLKHTLKLLTVSFHNWWALKKLEQMEILQNIDLIHINMERDLFGMRISNKYNIPNITHIREFLKTSFNLEFIYRDQISYMNQHTDCFIAISGAVMNYWVSHYGLDEKRIRVIYDGVHPESVTYMEHDSNCEEALRLVMCGTISEGKGQFELIKAVSKLVEEVGIKISVDFYGAPPHSTNRYYRSLLEYIEKEHLENIFHFQGFCNHETLLGRLTEYDVGVMCSRSEGFGLVTIEYMLAGLCVVASDSGANLELVNHGQTGFLYPLGNIEELAAIILYVYQNRNICKDIAKSARDDARNAYSIEKSISRLVETYYDVCGREQL